ncbi:MAG: type I methionyl aminopeptidase [Candidatus Taylorbacteria bacterium RIFCSPHIGHO2_01_FULL_46_22b]|uniref:Methionine aminopeptidase n=1 Tax=Candidatus Taylorbacteria bacterium RIFCSPHIGHO2_01_FULL_46_22b TaxID=1802301 RepID=A0A1G2M2P5_9BACT|nr:MAG: type I methionyl aminopeptidase [Candidatus Taylorbacteria bacterium RIFCSPHIGHO2_01_FULL_46_22b]
MVTIKNEKEIALLREGGRRLAQVISGLVLAAIPGVSGKELDELAEKLVREKGDIPSFLHYKAGKGGKEYPASLCLSINDEVVHGLPAKKGKSIKEGDLVSIDMGLIHEGMFLDSAVTIGIGKIDPIAKKLISVTKQALEIGIAAARAGNHVGDIGYAIETFITPNKFGIVRELAGHGVGYAVHEDPYVPNYGKQGQGEKLLAGMVIAIEPMVNEGSAKIVLDKDGHTFRTADGKRSAHFEHTVLITDGTAEVLTQ